MSSAVQGFRSLVGQLWEMRALLFRFGVVGIISTSLQLSILSLLIEQGWIAVMANAAGFIVGAQVSYLLSTFVTWYKNKTFDGRRITVGRWITFNLVASVALAIGSLIFLTIDVLTGFAPVVISLIQVAASAFVTFFFNNWLTFRTPTMAIPSHDGLASGEPIDLSIVIPAYREGPRIAKTLQELAVHLTDHNYGIVEVVVVTADSPDRTVAIVAEDGPLLFRHFTHVSPGLKVGKGRDVALGMLHARGRYRIFMDADLATPLAHLQEVKSIMDNDYPVAIGIRNVGYYHLSRSRNMLSRITNLAVRILVVPGIRDTQCGFKVFRYDLAEYLFSHMRIMQWNFDMEILLLARLKGYRIRTIDIPDWHDPKPSGESLSGESYLRAILRGMTDPLLIRLNVWLGRYGTHNDKLLPLTKKKDVI